MSQFPVLEGVVVFVGLNVSPWDFHKRQGRPGLLFHRDLIWVNFVPANHSPDTVIHNASTDTTLKVKVK